MSMRMMMLLALSTSSRYFASLALRALRACFWFVMSSTVQIMPSYWSPLTFGMSHPDWKVCRPAGVTTGTSA